MGLYAAGSTVLSVALVSNAYRETLFASIPGGDSGELVAEACRLGHAHPPGYPLFILMYNAAIRMPLEGRSPAWKANALSAALGVGTVTLLNLVVIKLLEERGFGKERAAFAAVGVSAGFGLSELVWQYSIGAEVFALNNFLMAGLLLITVRYAFATSGRDSFVRLGALWSGLALCNQHTSILFEVPLISWVLFQEFKSGFVTVRKLFEWGFLFLLGLSPYIYLPMSLQMNRQQGSWGDTTTLAGFVHHFRRGDYGTFRLYSRDSEDGVGMMGRLFLYFENLIERQGLFAIPTFMLLGILGIFVTRTQQMETRKSSKKIPSNKKRKDEISAPTMQQGDTRRSTIGFALLMAYIFYLLVFHFLSNMPLDQDLLYGVQARFWMQPNLLAFVFAGIGLCELSLYLERLVGNIGSSFVLLCVALAIPSAQLWANFSVNDQSRNTYMEQYGRTLLSLVPPNSVLFVGYDQQWTSLRYLQQCLGERPDVTVLDSPMVTYSWFPSYHEVYHNDADKCVHFPGKAWVFESLKHGNPGSFSTLDFVRENIKSCKGGVYFAGSLPNAADKTVENEFAILSLGLVKQLIPKASDTATMQTSADIDEAIKIVGFQTYLRNVVESWRIADELIPTFPPEEKYSAETWEWTIPRDYFDHWSRDAANILSYAIERSDVNLMTFAGWMLERAYGANKEHFKAADMKNLGLAFITIARTKSAPLRPNSAIDHIPFLESIFGKNLGPNDGGKITNIAAIRGYEYWKLFLGMNGAEKDTSFENIKLIVKQLRPVVEKVQSKQDLQQQAK